MDESRTLETRLDGVQGMANYCATSSGAETGDRVDHDRWEAKSLPRSGGPLDVAGQWRRCTGPTLDGGHALRC